MTKKGILLIQDTTDENKAEIRKIAPDHHLVEWTDGQLPEGTSPADIDIIYGWDAKAKKVVEAENSQLKWIQASSAGVDYLDLNRLQKQNVQVTNVSGIHSIAIAESVFAMILYKTRGLLYSVHQQRKKEWTPLKQMYELHTQTILIAGTGHIGKEVARLAKAFGMTTIGINRSGRPVENIDHLYTQDQLFTHVPEADIVVNILPLTKETKNLYNKDFFKKMKKEAMFINVGRGPSVHTEDLVEALKNGELAYAGLDVVEVEPLSENSPLWEMDNVLITPHISGVLEDYAGSCFSIFKENLQAYIANQPFPLNNVDLKEGY